MRLKDSTAIVTGAASGIGREIVFACEGAKVAIADLDQKAADATTKVIDPTGRRAVGVAIDVANEQQVDTGTAKVIKTFRTLDVLISNAGIQIVAPVVDFEFAKWKRLLSIHLDGAFLTTRTAPDVQAEGAEYGVRASVICPGFVRTPLVDNQIPERVRSSALQSSKLSTMSC